MAETLADITRSVATLTNLPGARQFSDPEIKEFINRAVEWVNSRMLSHPVKDIRFETTVTLPQGQTSLTVGAANELPDNFIIPIRMWEEYGGKWKEMTQTPDHLPINATPQESLMWWEWREGKLNFVGANQEIDIKLHYRGSIPGVSIPLDTLQLNGLGGAVIAKAAAIGLVVAGHDQAQYWEGSASELLDRFISTNIKPYQAVGFRRRRRRISLPPWRY